MQKRHGVLAVFVAVLSVLAALSSSQPAFASVHCMRVYGVMGGLDGDTSIQYVELRMTDPSSTLTTGSLLHFYNASGTETGTFMLTANMPNGYTGAPILIGTSNFDASWAAGSPDFTMPANVMAPSGKVAFGPPNAFNCVLEINEYDSVAYGTTYTGGVDYPPAFASNLPTAGNQALQIIRTPEHFDADQDDNAADYQIVSSPMPCKNAPSGSPVCGAVVANNDLDGDGVLNVNDDCPNTPAMTPVDVNGCSDAQADTDGDGWCNPGITVPGGPTPACTLGPDNCPTVANPGNPQPNADGDALGNACDTEGPGGNMNGVAGGDDCADVVDNDGDTLVDLADPGCSATDTDGDGVADVVDNCVTVPNNGQENFDGDAQGNACDADDDNDGYSDEAEAGSPVCVGLVNDDNNTTVGGTLADDTLVNDGCPAVGAAESICTGSSDEDGDGRVNDGCPMAGALSERLFNIGTGTLAPCNVGAAPAPSPSWPADLYSSAAGGSIDMITLTDITSFLAPVRRLDTNPPGAAYSSRWDLVPGRKDVTNWISLNDLTALLAGPSGYPAMFGGARAFGGPACTGP